MNISGVFARLQGKKRPRPPVIDAPYKAFLSYSRDDESFARRLHDALESYVLPRGIESSLTGPSRRLYPIFRDRDELPASPDLVARIENALKQSAFLVVICSTSSAASKWVNWEVEYFQSLGRGQSILCVMMNGTPSTSFCPALRGLARSKEPLFADAREEGLSFFGRRSLRREAALRLVAGILRVDFDFLRRRDRKRVLIRRFVTAGTAGCVSAIVLASLSQYATSKAQQRVARVQGLVKQAQQQLSVNDPIRAIPYLVQAYKVNDSASIRLLLAHAMAPIDALFTVIAPKGHKIRYAIFSPSGNSLATVQEDGVVSLRSVAAPEQSKTLGTSVSLTSQIAFSPDETYFATTHENIALLFSAATGTLLKTLSGHEYDIKHLKFSFDSTKLVTASVDNTARLWDAASGKTICTLRGHSATVDSAEFSPDNTRILTTSNDGTARIWDAKSCSALKVVKIDAQFPVGVFGPEAKRFVVRGAYSVSLFDSNGMLVSDLRHVRYVLAADFAADGTLLVATTSDNGHGCKVWRLPEKESLFTVSENSGLMTNAGFDQVREQLLTSSFDRYVRLWSLKTGDLEEILPIPSMADGLPGGLAALSPRHDVLLLVSNGEASLWRADATSRVLQRGDKPTHLRYSMDGTLILAEDTESASVLDVRTGSVLAKVKPPEGLTDAVFDKQGNTFATLDNGTKVRLWSSRGGKLLWVLAGHTQQVVDVDYSVDGKRVLTAGEDGMVYVWSAMTGSRLSSLTVSSPVRSARFSPDTRHILTVQAGGAVAIWDSGSGRRIMDLRKAGGLGDTSSAAYAPKGEIFLTDLSGTKVYDSDAKTFRLVREATGDALVLGSDGSRFLTHSFTGPIRNWLSEDGKLLATLQQDHALTGGIQFSPDMAFILTVFSEKVEVFDSTTGQLLLTLSESAPIRSAVFSPTQPQISTSTIDGRVRVWNLRRESRRPAEIEKTAGRFLLRQPASQAASTGGVASIGVPR